MSVASGLQWRFLLPSHVVSTWFSREIDDKCHSTQHPSSTAGSTAKKKRVDLPLCFTRMVASSECRLVHWRPMDGLVMPA